MRRNSTSNLWGGMVSFLAVLLAVLGLCAHAAPALPGSGTQEDPWRIESLADFDEFAGDPNYWMGYTRLQTDINLTGRTYTNSVIARDESRSSGFQGTKLTGVFDGAGHKVWDLTIDDGGVGNEHVGLFGCIQNGEVKNLGVEGGFVSGSGERYVGGLVGHNNGSVSNCYFTGSVNGAKGAVGGLAGRNYEAGSILNCYSSANVIGNVIRPWRCVGGLAGDNYGVVSNCYSTGTVSGYADVGGLVGRSFHGSTLHSFWDIDASGMTTSAGGTGLPTAEMQVESTFTSAGWDFTTPIWTIDDGNDYPRLWWESFPGPWSLEFAGFNIIEKDRLGRTIFRYVLSLSLTNVTHTYITDAHIRLVSASEQVTSVIDDGIVFPLIEANATIDSNSLGDFFAIEVDRSRLIAPGSLTWKLHYTKTDGSGMQIMSARLPAEPKIAGDLTDEGKVDFEDLSELAKQWLWTGPTGTIEEDTVPDGTVNLADFAELAAKWGQ